LLLYSSTHIKNLRLSSTVFKRNRNFHIPQATPPIILNLEIIASVSRDHILITKRAMMEAILHMVYSLF